LAIARRAGGDNDHGPGGGKDPGNPPADTLAIGIVGGALALVYLYGQFTALLYAVTVCVYNFAWNMTHPFLLAGMASFDRPQEAGNSPGRSYATVDFSGGFFQIRTVSAVYCSQKRALR
jgi:hypothetical protein